MDNSDSTTVHKQPIINLVLVGIYLFLYLLFVWKYTSDSRPFPMVTGVFYVMIAPAILVVAFRNLRHKLSPRQWKVTYLAGIGLSAVVLMVAMLQIDPSEIAIGRFPAINDWLRRLFSGEFPYYSGAKPSGLPFLFVLAMPFYVLGDAGLLQIFSFALFAFVVLRRPFCNPVNRLRTILLFCLTPMFLFEVLVRSELFSNMVVALFYLEMYRLYACKKGTLALVLLGLAGGSCFPPEA